ncbi:bacillithiol system redox-active protein YtxJ [Desulfosporosinus sp.]|uniref:bacillithiol system redox-active protein YtxJ n=1 Tax=Desulfosporosinus sp. TaxID=157907 RepID=UPI0025BF622C|nr:bacillithiol system redox-active protein YtxJ [Desulfosporosinus sp.]MBC2724467.1 bacillithiol system redox-active protein YtxJ [Desulfosporosinus sp.]MBC2725398.1 bacillithiol system redox-active protein YtxJ [Desulfosporosinus sp.]
MAEFKEINSPQDLEGILEESRLRKIIIFKHSTACPTSARAWQEVQDFIQESSDEILVVMIKVIESRSISNQLAETLGVKHQSPQVLLLSNRQILWHTSHQTVTQTNIKKALEGEISPFNQAF